MSSDGSRDQVSGASSIYCGFKNGEPFFLLLYMTSVLEMEVLLSFGEMESSRS